jgi:hypothetical protein
MRGGGQLLYFRHHAAADIEQQNQVKRRLLLRKIQDCLCRSVIENPKIFLVKVAQQARPVGDLGIHVDQ